MTVACIVSVAISQVSLPAKAGLLSTLAGLVAHGWRRHLRRGGADGVRRLLYDRCSGWRVVDGNGREVRVVPARGTFVAPWLTLVWLKAPNRRRFLVAVSGVGARAEAARRLRVVLRCGPIAWS